MKLETAMTQPFLLNYSVPRKATCTTEGYYSGHLKMWAVNKNGIEFPIIEDGNNPAELITKTDTTSESDDQRLTVFADTVTKTMTTQESDDQNPRLASLELATKTEAELEHDDTDPRISGMFI